MARKLYESVYSAGDTRPAMDAYVGFRGRQPDVDALLRNRGFSETAPEARRETERVAVPKGKV